MVESVARTPIERLNITTYGQEKMSTVGLFRPADLLAGAQFIIAWGPRPGTTGPGFCVAPHATIGPPFPYDSDTKSLPSDLDAHDLLALAGDMAMHGAPFALLDAAFLVFPVWRTLTTPRGAVAHTRDGAWDPHNPDYAEEVLKAHREDQEMFQKRIDHDTREGLPAVEVVKSFTAVSAP